MSRFHTLTVSDIRRTTSDCSVITLDVPDDKHADFRFDPGQYLTLRADVNGEDLRRSYSLCSSPLDKQWSVAIKQIAGGRFSTFANQKLMIGDKLEVMPPMGQFTLVVDPDQARNYIGFAAGSGITPILSIIKTHLSEEPNSTFKLFYINRRVSSIILKEELEALKNIFLDRLEIFYFLTKEQRDIPLFNGRIDLEKLQILFKVLCPLEYVDHCFICGPKDMIFMVRDEMEAQGFEPKNIHYELFYTGDDKPEPVVKKRQATVEEGIQVTLLDGGKELHFAMPDGEESILDAALGTGADLPYACKAGVCSTCKCKVLEGTVDMRINYALADDEVANNFVLSCQAFPTSDVIKVDFDV
ncbi:MAG: 2Fe-2S iron-sulfur cluster-binding protein [Bacteroidota bacterium]